MAEDVMLGNAVFAYDSAATTAGANTYIPVHGITDIGAIGLTAERKEKTNLADKQKKYGAGLQDSPEKAIKGQVVPFKDTGDVDEALYDVQQQFLADCRAKKQMMVQITWEDGETSEFLFQPLGVEIDSASSSEWKIFTVNGSQNSDVTTTAPTKTP